MRSTSDTSHRSTSAFIVLLFLLSAFVAGPFPASAKQHLRRFNEFHSNEDGTIQFIEMLECCGSAIESESTNAWIESQGPNFTFYSFDTDLFGTTADRTSLVDTAAFAAPAGAPTSNSTMPRTFFEPIIGDTVRYRSVQDFVAIPAGALPTGGTHSVDRDLVDVYELYRG